MQPSIGRSRAGVTAVALLLALAAGCQEPTTPDPTVKRAAPLPPPARDTSYPTAPPPAGGIAPIHVSIATTGTDLDPDGYVVMVGDSIRLPVRINDTLTIGPLSWQYPNWVQLNGIAPNCATDAMSVRMLTYNSAQGPNVTFAVSCVGASIPPGIAGEQLLFVRQGRIYRTTVGSGSITSLTTGDDPTWSPDGTRIAFTRGTDVYVMNANGTNERLIATRSIEYPAWENYLGGTVPAWSPDGTRLALGSSNGLVIVRADSVTSPVSLEFASWPLFSAPAWSPDGRQLALVSDLDSWGGIEVLQIYVRDASDSDATHDTQLTNFQGWPFGSWTEPAWSPDGTRIAFLACAAMDHAYRCSDGALEVMNRDGSNVRLLARTRGLARPSWTPDGQSIIYANGCWNHDCPSAVLYVSADGTRRGVILDDAYSPSLHR